MAFLLELCKAKVFLFAKVLHLKQYICLILYTLFYQLNKNALIF